MEDTVTINTYFGKAIVDRTGIVRGSDEWEAEISKHNSRCFQILTSLGSGGYRKGAGLTDFGSGCGVAAMMWHWALLTYNTNKAWKNKEIHKVGQSTLGVVGLYS